MDFSLIVACYKDAPHLLQNVETLNQYLNSTKLVYEFVLVEDASPDNTAEEVRKSVAWLQKNNVPVQVIYHPQNTGRGRAVSDGIRIAKGDIVGYIDIDLEHLMDGLLPMILDVQMGKTDFVVGRRAIGNPQAKPLRFFKSYVYRWLVHWLINLPVADTECGLKVFARQKLLPVLDLAQDKHWFWDTEIVHQAARIGLHVSERWIVFVEDSSKKTTVRLWHDTWAYLKAIRSYRARLSVKH
jgi:glycosyltransferase involved in cell wall biosynthesis